MYIGLSQAHRSWAHLEGHVGIQGSKKEVPGVNVELVGGHTEVCVGVH